MQIQIINIKGAINAVSINCDGVVEQRTGGYWLVNFPQCGEKEDVAEISIKEEDLKVIPVMNAIVNEHIKAQFDAETSSAKSFDARGDDLSGYLV